MEIIWSVKANMQAAIPRFTSALSLMRKRDDVVCVSHVPSDTLREEEVRTPDGTCLKIEAAFRLPHFHADETAVRQHLLEDLTLVPGIGPVRAEMLERNGVRSLHALINTRFWNDAREIAEIISDGSVCDILRYYQEIHRNPEPLLLGLASKEPDAHLFFDIETLGMIHAPVILLGCGRREKETVTVTQYLVRDIDEELPALMMAAGHFSRDSDVVSYNGRAFDIPYLNDRLSYYGERTVRFRNHFDLLHPTRRLFRNRIPNCCLSTVEEYILHLTRDVDIPGSMVPVYYQNYLRRRDLSILKPIVEHNKMDVANLARLLSHETEMLYGRTNNI